jgi:hypothetical protein
MKRFILAVIVAVAMVSGVGLSAASPVLASAHPLKVTHLKFFGNDHKFMNQVPNITCPCGWADAALQDTIAPRALNAQFGFSGSLDSLANFFAEGNVHSGYPFFDSRFNSLYNGDQVFEISQTNGYAGCAGVDNAFHSSVLDLPCDVTQTKLWVAHGQWWISVGETNSQNNYPYGAALIADQSNFLDYVEPHEPLNNFDQWGQVIS